MPNLKSQVWAVPFLLLVSVLCAGQAPLPRARHRPGNRAWTGGV